MSTLDFLPLLKAPESWPTWLVGAIAMLALAALDVAGALAAKQWAATSGVVPLLLGAAAFLVLFWVYASALQYAELALVTMGWIVVLQVGLLLIDRFHFGVHLAPGKWVAAVVILAAQGYLLARTQRLRGGDRGGRRADRRRGDAGRGLSRPKGGLSGEGHDASVASSRERRVPVSHGLWSTNEHLTPKACRSSTGPARPSTSR